MKPEKAQLTGQSPIFERHKIVAGGKLQAAAVRASPASRKAAYGTGIHRSTWPGEAFYTFA